MAVTWIVTIDNTKVSADLTDYPVYIDLSDMPAAWRDVVTNGWGDIRCYKSDWTTELAREVVSCDTATNNWELHVKYSWTLSSSVDTDIKIVVDWISTEPAAWSTYGSEAVWSDYKAVYHMNEASGNIADATGNGNTGTANWNPTYSQSWIFWSAIDLDWTWDYFEIATSPFLSSTFSIQALVKSNDWTNRWVVYWEFVGTDTKNYIGYFEGSDNFIFDQFTPSSWWVQWATVWTSRTHILANQSAVDSRELFTNWASDGTASETYSWSTPTSVRIWSRPSLEELDWQIDEIRFMDWVTVPSWRATTEYNNWLSASTFYSTSVAPTAQWNFFMVM